MIKVLAISFLVLAFASGASAALPQELEREIEATRRGRDALLQEQARLERELEVVNREARTLGSAVKSLDATRKKLVNDIKVTKSKISSANLNIRALETTMTEKAREIVIHKGAIARTIQELVRYDSRSLLADVLSYSQISDVWRDRGRLTDLAGRLDQEIQVLEDTKLALAREKELKERTKRELVGLESELGREKRVVDENQAAKSRLLAETKSKETEYQRLLAENLARQKEFEEDLFKLETQLRVTLDPSLIPREKHGTLTWPLDKVFVTGKFGYTNAGIYASSNSFHNGTDFRASMGTAVKAPLGGVIAGTGNTDEKNAEYRREGRKPCVSYGRWILIKHDNGLSTVFAHLSGTLVSTGQRIETGEIVGYSGGAYGVSGSGYSFGPHLHMGLLASQGVEIRQLTNSKGGCQEIYMPIARGIEAYLDPLAYLPTL